MSENDEIRITLEQQEDFAFLVRFDGENLPDLHTDEPPPLGAGAGPNPSRLLLAAIANCLAASLLFALRKFKNQSGRLRATARTSLARGADGRWRIPRAWVELHLPEGGESYQSLDRILDQFENFCVVTQSVRQGVEVEVVVRDGHGRVLRGDDRGQAGSPAQGRNR